MSVCQCVCASVVGACEIDHWIALGVWSSAGGVVGSPSTMPSSNAKFSSSTMPWAFQSPDGRDG